MGDLFKADNIGDIRRRFKELWDRCKDTPGYSDGLRGDVLWLITEAQRVIPFDAVSKGHADAALGILHGTGNPYLALGRFHVAIESHLA